MLMPYIRANPCCEAGIVAAIYTEFWLLSGKAKLFSDSKFRRLPKLHRTLPWYLRDGYELSKYLRLTYVQLQQLNNEESLHKIPRISNLLSSESFTAHWPWGRDVGTESCMRSSNSAAQWHNTLWMRIIFLQICYVACTQVKARYLRNISTLFSWYINSRTK